jgi:aspartate carbamoyltransferase catalytic subunit
VSRTEWDAFYGQEIAAKLPSFERDGRIYDCLYSQQFDRTLLDRLCRLADRLRAVTKDKAGDDFVQSLLSNKRAMLYFSQPSTRTFMSFLSACHILGIRACEIRDLKTSSAAKGESHEDTIRTFSSYVDLIIMRHHEAGFVEKAAWVVNRTSRPVPVVNAGSGSDQHPTQALLDIYTLNRYLKGGLDGKRVMMVGDLKRGRTVRSLSYLLKNYRDVHLTFVSPEAFRMEKDILDFLKRQGVRFTESDDFAGSLPAADAVYMTRVQDEYDAAPGESRRVDTRAFHFRAEHLRRLKPDAILMHPLPRRDEIETAVDDDERAVYWRQERNGMWIRAALIALILGVEKPIMERP